MYHIDIPAAYMMLGGVAMIIALPIIVAILCRCYLRGVGRRSDMEATIADLEVRLSWYRDNSQEYRIAKTLKPEILRPTEEVEKIKTEYGQQMQAFIDSIVVKQEKESETSKQQLEFDIDEQITVTGSLSFTPPKISEMQFAADGNHEFLIKLGILTHPPTPQYQWLLLHWKKDWSKLNSIYIWKIAVVI